MYKTVKLGDASLQYTIVSQSDEPPDSDDEPEGMSTTTTTKRYRRKTSNNNNSYRCRGIVIFILLALTLGCGVVIAAVLVPILVASKLTGYLPEAAKFQTFAVAASSVFQNSPSSGDQRAIDGHHRYVRLLPVKEISFVDEQYRPPAPAAAAAPTLPPVTDEEENGRTPASETGRKVVGFPPDISKQQRELAVNDHDKIDVTNKNASDWKRSDLEANNNNDDNTNRTSLVVTTDNNDENIYPAWNKITRLARSSTMNFSGNQVNEIKFLTDKFRKYYFCRFV